MYERRKPDILLVMGDRFETFAAVVVAFSFPARILRRFSATRALADKMPFNFGTSLFSVHGDLMDRFGAPVELRFSRDGVASLFHASALADVRTAKLKSMAGWAAQGVKPVKADGAR